MILVACVDDHGGLMFNHRRQSRDKVLRARLLAMAQPSKLWVTPYTARQFPAEEQDAVVTEEECLALAGCGEYCFAEDRDPLPHLDRIEQIVLFKWNREYPADQWFDIDVTQEPWKLSRTEEFEGSSHEKITMEVYVR